MYVFTYTLMYVFINMYFKMIIYNFKNKKIKYSK